MKSLKCVIRPEKLEDLKKELSSVGITGMMASEIKGFGKQKGKTEHYRGAEYHVSFVTKVLLEVVVADSLVDRVVDKMIAVARTGEIGDGKIFVSEISDVIRIRTGERGEQAL